MNSSVIQTNFSQQSLWHNLSCNWLWCVAFLLLCLMLSMNAASSTAPQHAYPHIQTLPQSSASVLVKPQLQRDLKPTRPQIQSPRAPEEKKRVELDDVT